MHKLSLHHLTMIDAHPLELVEAAAAGGFDYYGLRIVPPTPADSIVEVADNPKLVRELATRMSATGVRLLDIEAIWLQPMTNVQALLPALDTGRQLGARHVLTVGFDTDRMRLLDNFCRLCEAAAQFDMTTALEPITYCAISSPLDALAFVKVSSQPNARILIDALQFFRSGAGPETIDSLDPTLIDYMQICDGPQASPESVEARRIEARTSRLLPGDGELPLHQMLSRLPEDLTLAVEAPTVELRYMPFNEQAKVIGTKMRTFLANSEAR
jgi:sugar phosphate isomerase/epimerase